MAPDLEIAEKISIELGKRGNISSDGRPILGIPAKDLLQIVLEISEDCLFVPAHAWTPWFSLFGSRSGFDSIEECFEDYSRHIYAIETGLSSDPAMNWRVSMLDPITLLSNSDAHSPSKLGREANVFDCSMDFHDIAEIIRKKDTSRFLCTVEFFPEEGKYHYDGHRACGIVFSPEQTSRLNNICPVCNRHLTIGVMNRVEELADRKSGFVPPNAVAVKHLVPLAEIISAAVGAGVSTKKVKTAYEKMVAAASEFEILLDLSLSELGEIADERIVEGVMRVRQGNIAVRPGYDGEFGSVSIFRDLLPDNGTGRFPDDLYQKTLF